MGISAQMTALRAGELDVALMYSLGNNEFAYRELVPESLVIAFPENHPLAERDSAALKDLAQEIPILPAPAVAAVLHHAVLGSVLTQASGPSGCRRSLPLKRPSASCRRTSESLSCQVL